MKGPVKVFLVAGAAIGLLLVGYFQGYLHGVTGVVSGQLRGMLDEANGEKGAGLLASVENLNAHLRGAVNAIVGDLEVTVREKPFGMHVRRGSTMVEEVFPGFPAEKVGVRAGCEMKFINKIPTTQGNWLMVFQNLDTPFNMTFFCNSPKANQGAGPVSGDKHNFRVMVVKKPFGMNIQVNVLPRVVDVLPGSPAEKAGVKRGFVLKAVQDQPVDAKTWFDAWQKVSLPSTLTFDTSVPVHKDNPFFNQTTGEWIKPTAVSSSQLPEEWEEENEPVPGFADKSFTVSKLPFGMQVDAPPGKLPVVRSVAAGFPAEAEGVKAGDFLVKVAGRRVDSSNWFAAFQQAVPPFGIRIRRAEGGQPAAPAGPGGGDAKPPVLQMPVVGDLLVNVTERPFGMHVRRGSDMVQEVFPGFPAQRLGIRKGCEIREIAGKKVSQGTWMDLFQKSPLPFSLRLFCPRASADKKGPQGGRGPLSAEEHNFRVKVTQRPFGMNIQANVVPRVVEVLPGYPAEAAGVKAGYVLTHIGDAPVDATNWFDIWQKSSKGTVLTFDTNVPLHENNKFIPPPGSQPKEPVPIDDGALDVKEGYSDFRCAVRKLPFGMQVSAPFDGRPTVKKVAADSPAAAAGVKEGDVLIEVAGLPVDSASWFAAFQQGVPPFGLRFRRPTTKAEEGIHS